MCMFLTDFKLSNSLITILKAEACYICFLIIAISSLLWLAGDRKGSSHFPSKYNCCCIYTNKDREMLIIPLTILPFYKGSAVKQ